MGIEENKETFKQLIGIFNKGDVSAYEEYFTSDLIIHTVGESDADKEYYINHSQSRPGMTYTIDDMIAEGDKIFARAALRFPYEPSGNNVTVTRFILYRFEDGKVAEIWQLIDILGMYQQFGLLPPTEEIGKPQQLEYRIIDDKR